MIAISWIVTGLALIGVVLNIHKNSLCFVFWIITNAFWCIYDYHKDMFAQSFLFFVYFLLAIWGLIKWEKK